MSKKIALSLGLLLVGFGVLTLLILRQNISSTQDLSSSASVSGGQVELTTSPAENTVLAVNTNNVINLQVNTHGIQIDRLQLVFNIQTNTGNSINVSMLPNLGLKTTFGEVQKTSDGFLVGIVLEPVVSGGGFASSSPVSVIRLESLSTTPGILQINFDRENSQAIVASSNPPVDQLLTPTNPLYVIVDRLPSSNLCADTSTSVAFDCQNKTIGSSCFNSASAHTGSCRPLTSNNTDNSCTCIVKTDVNTFPLILPATPTPTPTPTPATTTYKACNESCSSNSECASNYRCYENRCRLVTNPSSDTCDGSVVVNQSCNQGCSSTNDCAGGYFCYQNRCRLPDNPASSTCAFPGQIVYRTIAESCNQSCSANRDCPVNFRCFYGQCRLVTNPSSLSCSPYTQPIISTIYLKPASTNKGEEVIQTSAATSSSTKIASSSTKTASSSSSLTDKLTEIKFTATPTPSSQSANSSPSAFAGLKDWFDIIAQKYDLSWPIIAIVAGILLLSLVIIVSLIRLIFARPATQNRIATKANAPMSDYEKELQQKISALKQDLNTPPPSNFAPPPVSQPAPILTPPPVVSEPIAPPVAPIASQPTTVPTYPGLGQSSMLKRIHDKGISPPGV